jgi:dTMP kinase
MAKGKLIVIEGTDASGKETQAKLLLKRLSGDSFSTKMFEVPFYDSPTGRIIGQCYLGKDPKFYDWKGDTSWFENADKVPAKVASLYYAADRLFNSPSIEKAILEHDFVFLDRYAESNMGHQGGKIRDPVEREKLVQWLYDFEYNQLKIPKPDKIFFLHMPTSVSLTLREKRGKGTGEAADGHESNIQHLLNAEESYLQIADLFKWEKISCAPDGTINSLKTPEQIHKEIYNLII